MTFLGNYFYAEASKGRKNDKTFLKSPRTMFNQPTCLTFYYNMYGQDIGSLKVSLLAYTSNIDGVHANMYNTHEILSKYGSSGSDWKEIRYQIPEENLLKVSSMYVLL